MTGSPNTFDLWNLFWKYEQKADYDMNPENRLAAATMAASIAKIIAVRESK